MSNPLEKQEGGQHYKDLKIQPIEYIHANNLGYIEGNIVKYVTRHSQKNGAEDIKKVIHYCELLLELEYGTNKEEELREPIANERGEGEAPARLNCFGKTYYKEGSV